MLDEEEGVVVIIVVVVIVVASKEVTLIDEARSSVEGNTLLLPSLHAPCPSASKYEAV